MAESPSDARLREAMRALGDVPEELSGTVEHLTFKGRKLVITANTIVRHCHFEDCEVVLTGANVTFQHNFIKRGPAITFAALDVK